MRVLVFSDIHGNLTALEAVLEAAGEVDAYWFLGDLVGYGPDPEACVQRVRSLPNLLCLQGNHDAAITGLLEIGFFNAEARRSLEWTRHQLSADALAFLRACPPQRVLTSEGITLVHGSPRRPLEEYLLTPSAAKRALRYLETPLAFVGHSHLPLAFVERHGRVRHLVGQPGATFTPQDERVILNPGSVGQPRDGDPRAAYALWDTATHTWIWQRVAYDIGAVQRRMEAAGLPSFHIYRLSLGR